MGISIIFPGVNSYYDYMGMEVFENFSECKQILGRIKKYSGIDIVNTVIYKNLSNVDYKSYRQIAVMAMSICFYELWKKKYETEAVYFLGNDIGYISALVCADIINLKTAVNIIFGKKLSILSVKATSEKKIVLTGKKDLLESKKQIIKFIDDSDYEKYDMLKLNQAVKSLKYEKIIEIGPDSQITEYFRKCNTDLKITYFDTKTDSNWSLENLNYKKFFNHQYVILRILGMIVSTQNHSDLEDGYVENVESSYIYVKKIVENLKKSQMNQGEFIISDEILNQCIEKLNIVFQYKKVPIEEIDMYYKELYNETLVSVKQK